MRVTLNIDDDVHSAAKAIALRDGKTLGQVITELGRLGMEDATRTSSEGSAHEALLTPQVSNDLGKQIQERFANLGELPIAPRRPMRTSPFEKQKSRQ
jgi:hypothetical protein